MIARGVEAIRTQNTAPSSTMPSAPSQETGDRPGEPRAPRWRRALAYGRNRPTLSVALVLGVLALVMYGPPVSDHGFYYDDWALAATMQDAEGSFVTDYYTECEGSDVGGRPGACLYHAAAYFTFGQHLKGYHVLALGMVWLTALLIYILLARCRMPRAGAAGVAAAFVLFPGSDSTRLWPTANNLSWALLLCIVGTLAIIGGLRRSGWRRWALIAPGFAAFLGAAVTYDGLVPVIALAGIAFWLAVPGRAAIVAGGASLALAVGWVLYRMRSNVEDQASFNVERTVDELVDREWKLVKSGWDTFDQLFLPGIAGGVAIAALVVVIAALVMRPGARRPIASWAVAAGVGVLLVIGSVSVYLTAHDLYVPQPNSVFNRLNVSASIGYCLVFVAGLGALYEAVRRLLPIGRAAFAAGALVALLVLPIAVHQYDWERTTQDSYAESWRQQVRALNAIVTKIDQVEPKGATIVSFGHPIWEARFIPVFAADWDLRGAIDERTGHDPAAAVPWTPDLACGTEGVTRGPETYLPYNGAYPMFWIDAESYKVVRIRSLQACQKWLGLFGAPPYFGKTVSG
jgi:hypothetical protein